MSDPRQVLALFEQANPVPDGQSMEQAHLDPAAYLATLQKRSSEMRRLDDRIEERPTRRNEKWIWTAAAIVGVIGVVAVLMNTEPAEPSPVTQPPATQDLEGYWSNGTYSVNFDGQRFAFISDGSLVDAGTYTKSLRESDNRIVTLTSDETSAQCSAGDVALLNYDFVLQDQLQLSANSDDCGPRPELDFLVLSPSDPFEIPEPEESTATSTTESPDAAATTIPSPEVDQRLDGSWRSTGVQLTFDNGRYELGAFVGPNPADIVDQGTYTTDEDENQVTLVSGGTGTQDCAPGDSRTLGYQVVVGESLTLTGGGDQCPGRGNLLITPLNMTAHAAD